MAIGIIQLPLAIKNDQVILARLQRTIGPAISVGWSIGWTDERDG